MPASYSVHVDWNNDGDFSDAREDVTVRALDRRMPIAIKYGRDQSRALAPTSPGEAAFELNNEDRVLSPENASSPLAGNVKPGRPARVQATLGGTTYTLFQGHTDELDVLPEPEQKSVKFTCLDPLAKLKEVQVSTGLYRAIRTGEAIHVLLDAVGWSATKRDIDVGASVLPYWWADGDDAFTMLLQLVDSEGPPALLTADGNGNIVFRDRHHRLTRSASTTAQATWRSGVVEPAFSAPTVYQAGWKEIVNSVAFDVPVRSPDSALSAVWSMQGQLAIADGETLEINASASEPFMEAVTPVAGTDYTLMSGTVSITLSRTSGASTTVAITAVGGPAVVSDLQVRALSVATRTTVRVLVEDSTSIAQYGRRSLPSGRDRVWSSLGDTRAIAVIILAHRAERLPTVSLTFRGGDTTRLTQQLTRDLSDRVRVKEPETGLDADCFIEQIAHTIAQGGLEHTTTFGVEKAAVQAADVFILGSATNGVLGTNRLGKRGLADPASMFVLGSVTNGVLGTNILVP